MKVGLGAHRLEPLAPGDRLEGVRRAWREERNPLRASVVSEPLFGRRNTGDNAPAMLHVEMVAGELVEVHVAAKGGGSENKAKFAALNPSDSVADWVVRTVETLGAGWCPPGMLGIGVGGSPEKAMTLAKLSLLDPIDLPQIPRPRAVLQGGGIAARDLRAGSTRSASARRGSAASPPCSTSSSRPSGPRRLAPRRPDPAMRRRPLAPHFTLDGSGPAVFTPPSLDLWPQDVSVATAAGRRVDLDG